MSLVFAGVCSHAPGITGRYERADKAQREGFHAQMHAMRRRLEAARPDALIVIAAEHFANFFMDNMPAYCLGMADGYEGPVEDEEWLGIGKASIPGNVDLAERLIGVVLEDVDVSYAQEWKFDHGVMVPLHFLTPRYDLPVIPANINCQGPPLTPLKRAWKFGESLRRACDEQSERIALIGTGGLSHWPCTPDSGKINEAWDREISRPLGTRRLPGHDRLQRCGNLPRRGPGRIRDTHLRLRGGRYGRKPTRDPVLRADTDLRRRLHRRHRATLAISFPSPCGERWSQDGGTEPGMAPLNRGRGKKWRGQAIRAVLHLSLWSHFATLLPGKVQHRALAGGDS